MLSLASEFHTPLHNVRTWIKFVALLGLSVLIWMIPNIKFQLIFFIAIFALYRAFGCAFFRAGVSALKPLWFFIVVILIWGLWQNEASSSALLTVKLLNGFALANLFTLTTRLDDMLIFFQKLLAPFEKLGLNPALIALSIALAIRFIPVLRQKSNMMMQSWRARSMKRPNWRIITPTTLLALDDAAQIADAIRARGGIIDQRTNDDQRT